MKKLIIASLMLAATCATALASDEITDDEKKIATILTTIAACTKSPDLASDQWVLDALVVSAIVSYGLTPENNDHIKRLGIWLLENHNDDLATLCRKDKPMLDHAIEVMKRDPEISKRFKQIQDHQ